MKKQYPGSAEPEEHGQFRRILRKKLRVASCKLQINHISQILCVVLGDGLPQNSTRQEERNTRACDQRGLKSDLKSEFRSKLKTR